MGLTAAMLSACKTSMLCVVMHVQPKACLHHVKQGVLHEYMSQQCCRLRPIPEVCGAHGHTMLGAAACVAAAGFA